MKATRLKKLFLDLITAAVLLVIFGFGVFNYFDLMLQDALFRQRRITHPSIVVIGIDERAIQKFGEPALWSREIPAAAIRILNQNEEQRPAVIGFDILFSGEREGSDALADAARDGGNVIVAARMVAVHYSVVGVERPFPALAGYVGYGAINAILDSDGRVRRTRFSYEFEGEILYSFPYEIYRMFVEYPYSPQGHRERYIIYHAPPGTFKQFSFADIFSADFQPEFLAGSIVLVGAFAPGLFDDFPIPGHTERMFGVEIHANILQMLLDGNFIFYVPQYVNWIIFLFTVFLALTLANFMEIRILLGSFVVFCGSYIAAVMIVFNQGYIITVVYVLGVFITVFAYRLIFGYVSERIARIKADLIVEKHQVLISSINYASVVQKGLLPKKDMFARVFTDYSIVWEPRDTVGGDIYWLKTFDNGALLAVCDCTGHGVPGALLTALIVSSLEDIASDGGLNPAEIIFMLDKRLERIFEADENKIKNGCDLAVLSIDKNKDVLISSMNTNVFTCDGKDVRRIKGQRFNIGEGKIGDVLDINTTLITASPNNKFYISSDGFYDQIGGAQGISFGYRPFKQLILQHHDESLDDILNKLTEAFENYQNNNIRLDDIMLISFIP